MDPQFIIALAIFGLTMLVFVSVTIYSIVSVAIQAWKDFKQQEANS